MSVTFPDYVERTLENFIRFLEKQKSNHVLPVQTYVPWLYSREILRLERERDSLKNKNNILRWDLRSEKKSRLEAEKRRQAAERQLDALLGGKNDDERSMLDLENEIRKLTVDRNNLFQEVTDVKEQLRTQKMHREVSDKTVEELRTRNSELERIVHNLQNENLKISKEQIESERNKE